MFLERIFRQSNDRVIFTSLLMSEILQFLISSGSGEHVFEDCIITVQFQGLIYQLKPTHGAIDMSTTVEMAFSRNRYSTVRILRRRPFLMDDRMLYVFFKVVSKLQGALGQRKVSFQHLKIKLTTEENGTKYGLAKFKKVNSDHAIPTEIILHIKKHQSLYHLFSTLAHELGHVLIDYQHDHDLIWNETTGLVAAIISVILNMRKNFLFCPFQFGVNLVKKTN
ncbi:MAG: hypothetical protein JAY66_27480 [Candidatus Thiodiazotropha taylori]|nr:hypothetical protein [Candidatus Thiodiazotropha taylori]